MTNRKSTIGPIRNIVSVPRRLQDKRRHAKKNQLLNVAMKASKDQDWRLAIRHWQKLITKYADIAPSEAWLSLARAHIVLAQYAAARSALHAGQARHPDDIRIAIEFGEVAASQEDWQIAATAYQAVVDEHQSQAPLHVWIKLSRAYLRLQHFDKSTDVLKQASRTLTLTTASTQKLTETLQRHQASIARTKADIRTLTKLLRSHYGYPQSSSRNLRVDVVLQRGTTRPTSSAFIRLISPLTQAPAAQQLSVALFDGVNYQPSDRTKVCIIQRTCIASKEQAERIVAQLRTNDAKLIIDLDDSFASINQSHSEYVSQARKVAALDYLIENADQFWASTNEVLCRYALQKHTKAYIVPNTLDQRVWTRNLNSTTPAEPLALLYMGTPTHNKDLALIMPALEQLAKAKPNSFKLYVMGVASDLPTRPWLHDLSSQIRSSLYPEFVAWFIKQGPFTVGLAPLEVNDFNLAKSDIKCLDYMAVGCVPTVSNLAPYQNKDLDLFIVRVSNSVEAWRSVLHKFVTQPEYVRKLQENIRTAGQTYLWETRSNVHLSETLVQYITE